MFVQTRQSSVIRWTAIGANQRWKGRQSQASKTASREVIGRREEVTTVRVTPAVLSLCLGLVYFGCRSNEQSEYMRLKVDTIAFVTDTFNNEKST